MAAKGFNLTTTPTDHIGPTSAEERVLLHRLAQGETTAFWELWEHYKTTLFFRLSLRWMGDSREDAEDALSNASIKAWRYLDVHAQEVTNVKAWLTRLLYNHCMNMHKANQKCQRYIPLTFSTYSVAEVSTGPVEAPPEEAMLRHEMRMYVRCNINRLPPQLREPLILYFFGNMPQRDIATHLNLSHEVVRKRLQNAKAILHDQMVPYLERGDGGAESTSLDTAEAVIAPPSPVHEEIASQVVAIRMVRITLPDGSEQHVPLALDHKPTRQRQKLATLRTYVQRHPSGWRKQVQLADLLYTMGHWEEAIAAFHQVLHRQPLSLNVRLRLGQMLRLLRRENEAIEIYEDAFALTGRAATQHYVKGCIAVCNRHLDEAVQLHTIAADLAPDNTVYRRDLGLICLQADCPEEALQAFDRVLHGNPDDLMALTFSYAPLMAAGRAKEARWRTERAWQCDPGNVLALAQLIDSRCYMGHVWGDSGTQTKALIRRAVQLAREVPEVQAAQAHYHMARGEQSAGLALQQQDTVASFSE